MALCWGQDWIWGMLDRDRNEYMDMEKTARVRQCRVGKTGQVGVQWRLQIGKTR